MAFFSVECIYTYAHTYMRMYVYTCIYVGLTRGAKVDIGRVERRHLCRPVGLHLEQQLSARLYWTHGLLQRGMHIHIRTHIYAHACIYVCIYIHGVNPLDGLSGGISFALLASISNTTSWVLAYVLNLRSGVVKLGVYVKISSHTYTWIYIHISG